MSICYYCGSRSGMSKKKNEFFACTTVFYADQWNQPTTEVIFWESEEAYKSSDVALAQEYFDKTGEAVPIAMYRSADGKRLAQLTVHDTVPSLELGAMLGKTSIT